METKAAVGPSYQLVWSVSFCVLVIILFYAVFAKGPELPVAFEADIHPRANMHWDRQLPPYEGDQRVLDASDVQRPLLKGRTISLTPWGRGSLSGVLFSTPAAVKKLRAAVLSSILMSSAEPIFVSLSSGSSTSASIDFHPSMLRFFLFSPDPSVSETSDTWYAEVSGSVGHRFDFLSPRFSRDSGQHWVGSFGDIPDPLYFMTPPRYESKGAEGVARFSIKASDADFPSEIHELLPDGQEGDGVLLVSMGDARIDVVDFASSLELSRFHNGRLRYGSTQRSVPGESVLSIKFGENSGMITLDGDSKRVIVTGTAADVHVDSDNLTPRVIEGWSWLAQALFWSIGTVCFERTAKLIREKFRERQARKAASRVVILRP